MAQRQRKYAFIALLLIAVAIGAALYFTLPPDQQATPSRKGKQLTPMAKLVDQQPLQAAQQLDKAATTREEARYSRDALRIADHEVDLAFASALRNARVHPAPENPETKQLHDHVRQLQAQVNAEHDQIKRLTTAGATAKGSAAEELQDRQKLLSAEAALHEDELEDGKRDLMRAGGDDESRIQRLFTIHEGSQHNDQAQPAAFQPREPFQLPSSMLAQLRLLWQLQLKRQTLLNARQQALTAGTDLDHQYADLKARVIPSPSTTTAPDTTAALPPSQNESIASLQMKAEDRKLLGEYDQRVQDLQQLAQTYGDWANLIQTLMRACIHAALQGLLWIVFVLALVLFGNMSVDRLSQKLASDRRRMATMRLLGRFVVQGLGIVFIGFILFGPPNQLSTIIALATAGLTVALKDFIVAFFGWFVLMGKNGIRVGDWVEINGIGGEVVEIGLLRTVLLETGNWADSGHPTGRRVTLVNSFAIEGHYFNFSTSGQWLWDNLELLVPFGQDPYQITESILDLVKKESEPNARQAEKEWLRAARDHGLQSFSAEPALNLRPTAQGTNIVVRYITRANERYAMRTRLYQHVVEILHHQKASAVQVQGNSQ